LSLFWVTSIQCIPPHSISLKFILILSSRPRLGFRSYFSPSGFPIKILYVSSSPHACYIFFPSHPPSLDNSNCTWWKIQVTKILIMRVFSTSYHFIPLRSTRWGVRISNYYVIFKIPGIIFKY
jgi:hypothetical protein